MRASPNVLSPTSLTAIAVLLPLLFFAAPAYAEEPRPATPRPAKHIGSVKYDDLAKTKAKTPKKRRESVQFEDVHVDKVIDKSSPRLNATSGGTRPGGGKPLSGGGLLDSQGGLGTTGPAGAGTAGAPRGGGAAPGPAFR